MTFTCWHFFTCHLHYISYDNGSCAVVSHLHCVQLFGIIWTRAHQAPLFMGFSGKDTGVGCLALLQEIFLPQGSNPNLLCLLHWQVGSLPLAPTGKPQGTWTSVDLGIHVVYTEPFLKENSRMTLKSQTKHDYTYSQPSCSKGFFNLTSAINWWRAIWRILQSRFGKHSLSWLYSVLKQMRMSLVVVVSNKLHVKLFTLIVIHGIPHSQIAVAFVQKLYISQWKLLHELLRSEL